MFLFIKAVPRSLKYVPNYFFKSTVFSVFSIEPRYGLGKNYFVQEFFEKSRGNFEKWPLNLRPKTSKLLYIYQDADVLETAGVFEAAVVLETARVLVVTDLSVVVDLPGRRPLKCQPRI